MRSLRLGKGGRGSARAGIVPWCLERPGNTGLKLVNVLSADVWADVSTGLIFHLELADADDGSQDLGG